MRRICVDQTTASVVHRRTTMRVGRVAAAVDIEEQLPAPPGACVCDSSMGVSWVLGMGTDCSGMDDRT